MAISERDIEHIFERLRSGVVPERGLEAFAVGIDKQRTEIHRQFQLAANSEGVFKFLRGGYGCGKTFMSRLAILDAQAQGFVTSFVKSLFFCQSRSLAEEIAERMRNRGTDVFIHHSSVSLEERTAAEERFHRGTNASIICTSTLELGIDVGDLDLVLQANAPSTVSSFLQRLGRTGRRTGQQANTTFFCENIETVLQASAIIELAKKGWVESIPNQTRVWPVLVHQLLALTLQFGGISPELCWGQLSVDLFKI
ncbi:BREX system ATP-binding domain-containing protein [Nostoc sp.]|uniref:BREX system ATP-binding domain-containing protein n=1 Tax=Nostoc sp. TaxID=1180 RepID=UPI002FF6A9AA